MLLPLSSFPFMFIRHSWEEVLKELATRKAYYLYRSKYIRVPHADAITSEGSISEMGLKYIEINFVVIYKENDKWMQESIGPRITIPEDCLPQNIKEKIYAKIEENKSADKIEVYINDEVELELASKENINSEKIIEE